jgi:hypothetical protein
LDHSATYERRVQLFGEEYEDFAPSEIIHLIVATGTWLEGLILDSGAVNSAMLALATALFGEASFETKSWKEVWESEFDALDLPLAQKLTSIYAFAHYGLCPVDNVSPDLRETEIGKLLVELRQFVSLVPPKWSPLNDIQSCILAAEGRFSIDTDKPVTPEQLAALAQLQIRSFKNLLMPSSGSGLREAENGMISADEARRWLATRSNFQSSLWQDGPSATKAESASATNAEETIFVPVDSEGNWFDPVKCRRAGKYTIGSKGDERQISDFRDALHQLSQMKIPRWRRPNEHGNWGIVRAKDERWLRKTAAELCLI